MQHDPLAQRTSDPGPLFAAAACGGAAPPPAAATPPAPSNPEPIKATPQQVKVLRAVIALGGRAAIWQVAAHRQVPDHCTSQRFSELVSKGLLTLTGETNLRAMSHKPCKIYEITPAGRVAVEGR